MGLGRGGRRSAATDTDRQTFPAAAKTRFLSAAIGAPVAQLYRLPVMTRCGRVNRKAYHVWGMGDAGILLSQRTGGGRAAALGTIRERACLPAGSDDREHARGDGA